MRQFLQSLDFIQRQMAEFPFRQITERKIACPDPLEPDHRAPHTVEHAAHLALSAFMDGNLDPGVRLFFPDLLEFSGRGLAVVEKDAPFEALNCFFVKHAFDLRKIGLRQLMFGMRNQVRKIAVVRQDQHALGVEIQPAHRIYAYLDAFQQVLYGGPALRVGHGRNIPRWFVQHKVGLRLFWIDELAVNLDVVVRRVGLGAEFGHDLAVHAHPAFGNKLFSGSARCHPGGGYDLLYTFLHEILSDSAVLLFKKILYLQRSRKAIRKR